MSDITITPKVSAPNPSDKGYVSTDLAKLDVGNALGIQHPLDIQFDNKLSYIIDHISESGKASKGDMLQTLRSLQTKLGSPRYGHGESKLGEIYNYLKAEAHLREAQKVRNSFL